MINITFNGQITALPENVISLKDLVDWKNIPVEATAVALNGKLVRSDKWEITKLSPADNILVISAAYGG